MRRPARTPLVVALLVVTLAAWGAALPPRLVDAKLVVTLSPAAIDKLAAVLWSPAKPPAAAMAVDSWLLTFRTTYPDGAPATVTAQLFVPRFTDEARRPLYVFASGSTGLSAGCRVSREHIAGIRWGLYRTHVLAWAGQGIVGLLPDYMGFQDKGRLQPFYSSVAEGRDLLDAIRAAREFIASDASGAAKAVQATVPFVAGFSQGGNAAFAAADMQASWAPDVKIAGVVGYGPAADVQTLFREFPVDAPMAIYTYSTMYGKDQFDPGKILLPKWAETLEDDVTRQCIGGMQAYYPWTPREMFQKDFADALLSGKLGEKYPTYAKIMDQNSSGLTGHKVPALILEGTDDIVVSVKSQTAWAEALRAKGSAVQLSIYKGVRHDSRQAGFAEALAWVRSVAAGGKPPSGVTNK